VIMSIPPLGLLTVAALRRCNREEPSR